MLGRHKAAGAVLFAAVALAAAIAAAFLAGPSLAAGAFSRLPTAYSFPGIPAADKAVKEAYALYLRHSLQGGNPDATGRFIAARRIGAVLIENREFAKAASFFMSAADSGDRFAAWYLFSAAGCYEADGGHSLAGILYERIVKTLPDMEVDGKSLHYESLSRLVDATASPERRIVYFRDLITRFPERPDPGIAHYLIALEYERTGQWDLAIRNYALFLPWFGTEVPGHPDALDRARRAVEFSSSPRSWGYANLQDLVSGVRAALASGSASKLRKFAARVGFFAESWHQEGGAEANSRVLFDFSEFMRSGPIRSEAALDPASGSSEAYLRTWGWTGRVSVWYLYFRKIHFPADPEVHGSWEWAGIYFGEKMR